MNISIIIQQIIPIVSIDSNKKVKRAEYMKQYRKKNREQIREQYREKRAEYMKQYHKKNREQFRERAKQYFEQYREKRAEYMKQYRKKNREQIRERAKQYCERTKEVRKQYTKQYIQNNLVKAQTYYRNYNYNYYKRRRRVDKLFKAKCALRAAVSSAFKRIGQNKPTRTEQLLGCSWIEAKAHFDRLFQEGMSWENHGKWHIDHIRPVGSFKADELHLMNHISNLQPLWAYDNMITKKIADNLKWGNGTQPTE